MRKLVGLMMVVGVLMFVGCVQEIEEPNATFEDVQVEDTWQCTTHAECFEHGHSFCMQGECVGDPQPEVLPEEDVTADNEDVSVEEDVNEEVEPVECTSHTECPLGHSCQNGQCMANAKPECLKNEDCGTGIACECKQGSWQMCTTHVCENYVCGETIVAEQCEFGCGEGKCLPPECETDADCSALDSTTCDGVWLLTVEGQCYKGKCEANNVSGVACQFGCADGACLSDPEVPECLTDADCGAGGGVGCESEFVMVSTTNYPECVNGVCATETFIFQCNIPCVDGCYDCWQNSDCDDGNACTTDMCGDHECYYDNACACKSDANCDDGNACTLDSCTNGSCKNVEILNCVKCTEAGECGGAATGCWGNTFVALTNLCNTLGYCTASSAECEFGCNSNLGCKSQCESVSDCYDGEPCTVDSCADGKCVHADNCLYGEYETKLKCQTNADCEGTGFGAFCQSDGGQPLCQPCMQLPSGDVGCGDGKFCAWGITSVKMNGVNTDVSSYSCVECLTNGGCNDGNPCTEDTCVNDKCEHMGIKGCFACKTDTDCEFKQVCYQYEGADTEWTWNGKCLPAQEGESYGKCEITEKKCKTACAGDSCEKLECESDADCGFGQYCTDKFLCGWTGDLQCKFECPAGKKFAWVMSAKPDEVVESGTGVFKASPTTLCMWGWENPAFKFNCWDGTNNNGAWSDGDKAVVTCNEENFTVVPDVNYGSQGVQVVTFFNVYCGF